MRISLSVTPGVCAKRARAEENKTKMQNMAARERRSKKFIFFSKTTWTTSDLKHLERNLTFVYAPEFAHSQSKPKSDAPKRLRDQIVLQAGDYDFDLVPKTVRPIPATKMRMESAIGISMTFSSVTLACTGPIFATSSVLL